MQRIWTAANNMSTVEFVNFVPADESFQRSAISTVILNNIHPESKVYILE